MWDEAIPLNKGNILEPTDSDEQIYYRLDHFATYVDNQIQTSLVSELMERYVEASRQLDIKRKQLERSDAARQEAQKIALLGNWELDKHTMTLWCSDTMNIVLEIDDSRETSLQTYLERIHPDDFTVWEESFNSILNGKEYCEYEHRLLMKDNRIKWVQVRCVNEMDKEGNRSKIHGTIQDITHEKNVEAQLKEYNDHLEVLVNKKVAEVSASQMTTIYALVSLAESRDDETGEHISRAGQYCRLIAEELFKKGKYADEVNEQFIESITQASPLHDIGKVGIPDSILLKPGKLTTEEFEIMKTHTTIGYDTLASAGRKGVMNPFIKFGMEIALCHHEKWDGGGYPNGLRGDEIPISARIMALVDVYDALRSKRVYKEGFSHEKSVSIIEEGKGSHFDPTLVEIFLENQHKFRDIFERTLA